MSWLHDDTTEFLEMLEEVTQKKANPFFRPFENVGTRVKIGRKSYINFTSNDYLGLSQDERVIKRAIAGTKKYGTGLGSARPQATSVEHEGLEKKLATWMGFESCAIFSTGFMGMVGAITTFADDDTTLVCDKLSHASILDGAYLAQGYHPDLELRFFKHNSAKSLRRILGQSTHKKKMVVVEGLYSVDGDLAPLSELIEVCQEFDAVLIVDDAHGIGSLGSTGRGVAELENVLDKIDILFGSFSKSFGGVGGFLLADRPIIDYIKLKARSFMYSASLPVAQIESASAALDIIKKDTSYLTRLEKNRDFFREGLLNLGFDLGKSCTHICPIMIGDEEKTLTFAAHLFHGANILMMPFIYPGVPLGQGRLRCNVTAAHSTADIGFSLEALSVIGRDLKLIPAGKRTQAPPLQKTLWAVESKLRGIKNGGLPTLTDELLQAGNKLGQLKRTYF